MTEYQHFIPQLLLRNYSHPYKPPKKSSSQPRTKSRPEKGKYRGDKVLNVVDFSSDEPQLRKAPVSRWFGQDNMYVEVANAIKAKKDVERELAKLEQQTVERNILRKFLFIMKYRGPGFYTKCFDDDTQTYDSKDKHILRAYMAEKGMTSPREVWLHNLRTILDLDMDACGGEWTEKPPELIFPADAAMFIFHVQSSYMAFCTPEEKHDEFILTDQCYNVFERPINYTFCAKTNDNTLPNALEDGISTIQRTRQLMHDMAAAQFPDPQMVKSILANLPVTKAGNSYTKVVDGKPEHASGKPGLPMARDKFCFRFWPISTQYVNTINFVFLDNILHCKSIVYGTHLPFERTLEAYLTTSAHGLKKVGIGEHGAHTSRRDCLKKLSVMLGGEASQPCVQYLDDMWLEVIKKLFEHQPELPRPEATLFWQAYSVLGGSKGTFVRDLEQSWKLHKLQTYVASWTIDLDNSLRLEALANAVDFILQNLPRRVWLYVKH
ncbi:hypothetical protein BKA61DRAFT_639248 [Leptodontidium sp. MPI-SDFR-AT-0119]|nr:hypothetical protein BKA61DRAFT_639248 [Leptodontidium sp. MPI-SDFR-AT-0119]